MSEKSNHTDNWWLLVLILSLLIILSSFTAGPPRQPVDDSSGCLKLDVMIAVDVSSSIPDNKYPFIVNSVLAFANRFKLSEEGIKIGIVKFGDGATLLSPLTSDTNVLLMGIGGIGPTNGNTEMHQGFNYAGNELLTNGREGIAKIVIVISDGEPTYRDQARESANLLKTGLGVKIFGIFVEKGYVDDSNDIARLYGYPSKPSIGDEVFLKEVSSEGCYLRTDYELLLGEIEKLDICL